MTDAYEIGIELVLQDETSAGLQAIKAQLSAVDEAVEVTSANLGQLLELARAVHHTAGVVTPQTVTRNGVTQTAESPVDPQATNVDVPTRNHVAPQADTLVRATSSGDAPVERGREPVDTLPVKIPATAEIAPQSQIQSQSQPQIEPRLEPTAPHEKIAASPLETSVAMLATPVSSQFAEALPKRSAAAVEQSSTQIAPRMAEARGERGEDARSRSVLATRSVTSSIQRALFSQKASPPEARLNGGQFVNAETSTLTASPASAPEMIAEGRVPKARYQADLKQPVAPTAKPQDSQREMTGSVVLDGQLVGYWLAEHMAREASRPPTGTSFFDPRQSPAWTASSSL